MEMKKYIEESNQAFEAADAAGKRIMIATDVISRIRVKNISATVGSFWDRSNLPDARESPDMSVKEIVNEGKKCKVCAKGALFCCIIGRINQMTISELYGISFSAHTPADRGHKKLLEYFSLNQLDLIETAFEGGSYLEVADTADRRVAQDFFNEFPNSDTRLAAIMQNIIDHNGEFVPEDIPSVEKFQSWI